MTYFEDLSEHTYAGRPATGALNVGWLGEGRPFPTGQTSEAFRTALDELCNKRSINPSAGHHACEICPDASWFDPYYHRMGNGEIRVRDARGIWYVAPRLIIHYVVLHQYCPPHAFIEAVMRPDAVATQEQFFPSEEERIKSRREQDRQWRELLGPPMTEAELDEIVRRGIRETRPKRPWWRFW